MSETLVERYTPTNTRQDIADIIDVDDWFPDARFHVVLNRPQPHRTADARHPPQQQPAEVIVIESDDDGDDEVQITGHNRPVRPQPPRRALFSPPPPERDEAVPPVPPIPARFRHRRHIHHHHRNPEVLVPMDQAFDFEANLAPPPLRNVDRQPQAYVDIPVRHPPPAGPADPPRPGMGLGGARYALNRQGRLQAEGAERVRNEIMRRNEENRWLVNLPHTIQRLFGIREDMDRQEERMNRLFNDFNQHAERPREDIRPRHDRLPTPDGWQHYNPRVWDRGEAWIVGFNDDDAHGGVGAGAGKTPEYRSTFTHPLKAQAGFTHNFDVPEEVIVIDDASAPKSKSPTTPTMTTAPGPMLACASCSDPLVMNVSGSEEEQRMKRLWGLRCGHVLDGKCVERLLRPAVLSSGEAGSNKVDVKGEDIQDLHVSHVADINAPSPSSLGKRKFDSLGSSDDAHHPTRKSRRLDKGKGKAKAEPEPEPTLQGGDMHEEGGDEREVNEMLGIDGSTAEGSEGPPSVVAATNDMRSRLRPRRTAVSALVQPHAGPSSVSTQSLDHPTGSGSTHRPFARARPHPMPSILRKPRAPRGRKHVLRGPSQPSEEILETYEWHCPVSGCGRVHESKRVRTRTTVVGGEVNEKEEWRMHAEKGAIGVYV